jgi:hypothetical protein
MFGRFLRNMSRLAEGANGCRRSFLDAIKRWAVGADDVSYIARTLWLFVPPNFAPRFSDVFGGKVLNSINAGSGLHSLVYGLPPRLNDISHDPMTGDTRHLDYASPRSVVFGDDHVVIDNQWSFYFWDGGQISSKNFAKLLQLPVDICLRLEFQRGTPFLFVTPLLRWKVRKGDSQSVLSMSEKLLEISNWKLVTGPDLEVAWRAFFPGGPNLPGRFGRHSVRGWASVSPSGILQQVAEAIIPVGDPNGTLVLGHVGNGAPYLVDLNLYPSLAFAGPSKEAGKSTIMQVLAAQAKKAVVWVDLTASRLDRAATRIREEDGKVFELFLPDALDVLRNEGNNNPANNEVIDRQLRLHVEYGKIAEDHVGELVKEWKKYGFPTGSVAFVLKSGNTIAWLAYLDSFLNSLKKAMVDFYPQTGSDLLLVVDNWSHLANQQKDHPVLGSLPWDTAVNLARTINWFVTQGANAGIRIWIAIQNVDDFKKVIGDVIQSFNFLFKMGEDTGHLAKLINPQTGEVEVTLDQHLTHPLLGFVERIKLKGEEDEETDS